MTCVIEPANEKKLAKKKKLTDILMNANILICSFLLVAFRQFNASGQNSQYRVDTIRIDVKSAEQRFVQQNLSILAAKYDVDIAKSSIMQARLWYNPNITYSQTLYNYGTHKFLDATNAPDANGNPGNGDVSIQIQQLITYAGRHTNLVKLNKIDAERAQYIFEEVVRALKLELYNGFSTLSGDQKKLTLYNNQIAALDNLIKSLQEQVKLGVSSKNDLIRLQAERQDDRNQLLIVQSELQDAETDLKILLHYPVGTYLMAENELPKTNVELPAMAMALNIASQNRGDLKLAHKSVDYEVQNLKLQRSLAVPDLSIGAVYDRAGGAGYNYTGISLSSDIPIFNRNQGLILASKYQLSKAQISDSIQTYTVQNQVEGSYTKLLRYKTQYDALDKNYQEDLANLVNGAITNYNKKLISLLEFLDQMRAYTSAKTGLIDMDTNYFNAIQNLNYQVGTDIIK
jgi:cobalt-zinc-cadmium efflux system outer membrane protein